MFTPAQTCHNISCYYLEPDNTTRLIKAVTCKESDWIVDNKNYLPAVLNLRRAIEKERDVSSKDLTALEQAGKQYLKAIEIKKKGNKKTKQKLQELELKQLFLFNKVQPEDCIIQWRREGQRETNSRQEI